MASSIGFAIGGLDFQIMTDGIYPLRDVDEPYRRFTIPRTDGVLGDPVRVFVGEGPARPRDGRKIFDSGGAWSIFARDSERLLVFRRPGALDPLYTAGFFPGKREVTLACSSRLMMPFHYPLDQLLTMYFLGGGGLIVHAAGMVRGTGAVAFAGVSGAGKSTITRLAEGRAGFVPLSDDRVILRLRDEKVLLHGTPWPGEAGIAENRSARLLWFFFLEHGRTNRIQPLTPRESLPRLLKTASLPWFDAEYLGHGLGACEKILARVRSAVVTFRPEGEAIDEIERFLDGNDGVTFGVGCSFRRLTGGWR